MPRAYVKLTLGEPFPRIAVVRNRPPDGSVYLGPLSSTVWARRVKDAIESALPLRRCTHRIGARAPVSCPCAGSVDSEAYAAVVQRAVAGITDDANLLIDALSTHMDDLVAAEQFEEAARARDGLTALSAAFDRQRRLDALRRAGRFRVVLTGTTVDIDGGRMILDGADTTSHPGEACGDAEADADEMLLLARWLERVATRGDVRLHEATGELSSQLPRRPRQTVGSRGRMRVR